MFNDNDVKTAMINAIEHLKHELKSVRTGRANPAILDGVAVEVYGSKMKLKDVANITVPEPRQILITPYDANNASAIGKAIESSNLNIQAVVDGNAVRVNIPPMDEAVRKDMVKLCKKKAEEGKVAVREVRRRFNDEAKKAKSANDITEDDQKRTEKNIQELTDKYCKEIDNITAIKEKEVLDI